MAAEQHEMATSACKSAGPPLKDDETWKIAKSGERLQYRQSTWDFERSLCSSVTILDEGGKPIPLTAIGERDQATIYHYGNSVTKIQLTKKKK